MTGLDTCFLIDLYWQDSPRHKNAEALLNELQKDENIKLAVTESMIHRWLPAIFQTELIL